MIYGIDLGNCSSRAVALDQGGDTVIVPNDVDGKTDFPAYVYFEDDGTILTGDSARELEELWPQGCIRYAKRDLLGPEETAYDVGGRSRTAVEAVTQLFAAIRSAIENFSGDLCPKTAITVPGQFLPHERERLRSAARQAGFSEIYLVPEPVAALYAATYRQKPVEETALLLDVGGDSLRLAAVKLAVGLSDEGVPERKIRIVSVYDDGSLGGAEWDHPICCHLLKHIEEEYGLELDDEIQQEVRIKAERMKRMLSVRPFASCFLHVEGMLIRVRVTQEEFLRMTDHLVSGVLACVDELLKGSEIPQIDRVLLVGGGSQIFGIRDALEQHFPGKVQIKKAHLLAEGAAIAAHADGWGCDEY